MPPSTFRGIGRPLKGLPRSDYTLNTHLMSIIDTYLGNAPRERRPQPTGVSYT